MDLKKAQNWFNAVLRLLVYYDYVLPNPVRSVLLRCDLAHHSTAGEEGSLALLNTQRALVSLNHPDNVSVSLKSRVLTELVSLPRLQQ